MCVFFLQTEQQALISLEVPESRKRMEGTTGTYLTHKIMGKKNTTAIKETKRIAGLQAK